MAAIFDAFEKGLALKRKRTGGETDDFDLHSSRGFKRPNSAQLPIRVSSSTNQDRAWQNQISSFQGPLTPVDSSDDEAYGQADNIWFRRRTIASPEERFATYRSSPVNEAMDDEMDTMPTFSHAPKQMLSPLHRQLYLPSPPSISDERIPTPMKATFGLFKDTSRPRSAPSTRHTILSPVMGEEPYLPSPTTPNMMNNNADPDTVVRMEHASTGFGALSVACTDDDMMEDTVNQHQSIDSRLHNPTRLNNGRNAKLHMGFKADCEKCQQRVPGHYSHIIWS